MNKEKEIKELAKTIYESGVALDGTDFAFGVSGDDHFTKLAKKLIEAGYYINDNSTLKTYSDSVLMKQTKTWLIDQIRLLEQSCKDYEWQVNNQAKNYEKLLSKAKQQSVREFAERLKQALFVNCTIIRRRDDPIEEDMKSEEVNETIDELLAEVTGE